MYVAFPAAEGRRKCNIHKKTHRPPKAASEGKKLKNFYLTKDTVVCVLFH